MPRTAKQGDVPAMIDRMVQRIVKKFHPERIILFGSHARGQAGPDSDVDLLVVMPMDGCKRDKRLEIRRALRDVSRVGLLRLIWRNETTCLSQSPTYPGTFST